jgi:hypothetical protein
VQQAPTKPIFLFVVDVSCKHEDEIAALRKALLRALDVIPPDALVGFITFGATVSGSLQSRILFHFGSVAGVWIMVLVLVLILVLVLVLVLVSVSVLVLHFCYCLLFWFSNWVLVWFWFGFGFGFWFWFWFWVWVWFGFGFWFRF